MVFQTKNAPEPPSKFARTEVCFQGISAAKVAPFRWWVGEKKCVGRVPHTLSRQAPLAVLKGPCTFFSQDGVSPPSMVNRFAPGGGWGGRNGVVWVDEGSFCAESCPESWAKCPGFGAPGFGFARLN